MGAAASTVSEDELKIIISKSANLQIQRARKLEAGLLNCLKAAMAHCKTGCPF